MYLVIANATEASRPRAAKILTRGNAAEHVREQHVKDGAEGRAIRECRSACRASDFALPGRRRRDGIETDVGEEDDAGRAEDAEDSAIGVGDALRRDVSRRRWNQRRVVGRIDESPADADEEQAQCSPSRQR